MIDLQPCSILFICFALRNLLQKHFGIIGCNVIKFLVEEEVHISLIVYSPHIQMNSLTLESLNPLGTLLILYILIIQIAYSSAGNCIGVHFG